jgi:hypothetical protein
MCASIMAIALDSLAEMAQVNQLLPKYLPGKTCPQVALYSAPERLVTSPRILALVKIREQL